jgi:hypothetical protein
MVGFVGFMLENHVTSVSYIGIRLLYNNGMALGFFEYTLNSM